MCQAIVLSLCAVLSVGCSVGAMTAAQVFRGQTAKAIAEAVPLYDQYDKLEQDRIIAGSPVGSTVANLTAFHERVQKPIRRSIVVLSGALAALGSALDAAAKGAKADWLGLGLEVVRAGAELVEAIKAAGVPVPFTMPAFGGK